MDAGQHATPQHTSVPAVTESDFPALYRAADQNSLNGQRRYLTATRVRLTMLVLAAVFGLFSWRTGSGDIAGILAAAAFAVALLSELYLLKERPDRLWYDGRAAAESAKTLIWRYLVGGSPFGKSEIADRDAEWLLLDRFSQIARELKGVSLVSLSEEVNPISTSLRNVRALPLDERRQQYRIERIRSQRDWYARRARWNERRTNQWTLILSSLEALGLLGAVLKATGVLRLDLLGLAGTLVAAGAAWIQTKQHQTLASAYAVASQELTAIGAQIDRASTEEEWAHFVDQAEEAISREHTLWRASRS
jgi:SMODS and SLOG-associating 2TM effector domain 3/SMODS and SLOG-associating 2TM effector domain 1